MTTRLFDTWRMNSAAIFIGILASSGPSRADWLPIANPGFEADIAPMGNFVVLSAPQAWAVYDPSGIIDGANNAVGIIHPAGTTYYAQPVPEGVNAGIIYLATLAGNPVGLQQTLAATLAPMTRYTLTVSIGNIASGIGLPPSSVYGYFNLEGFPGYQIDLFAGTNLLTRDRNRLGAWIPEGTFRTVQLEAVTGSSPPGLGLPLTIRLINLNQPGTPEAPGIEVNFDDVSLFAEPTIPASRFAVLFYGTGAGQADRIKIPLIDHPAINVGGDFTIECWMKSRFADNAGSVYPGANGDGWIEGNVLIDRDVYGAGDYGDFGVALGRVGTNLVAAFGVNNGSAGETIVGTNHLGDNRWHHLVVTRVATSGLMRIWVDGYLSAQGIGPTGNVSYRTGRSTSFPQSDPYLVFAAEKHDAGTAYPSFNGHLDEVQLWNRALHVDEFWPRATKVLPAADQNGLVGYWRLEEGTNTFVRDHSVHAAHGVLSDGTVSNGHWTSLSGGGDAAPVNLDAPHLGIAAPDADHVILNFVAHPNFHYHIEGTPELDPSSWSTSDGYTNFTGNGFATNIARSTDALTSLYLRVRTLPYR